MIAQPLIVREEGNPPFSPRLCCFVHRVEYDFDKRSGLIILDDGSTDMGGAIAFFTAIDPGVRDIITRNYDGERDTEYHYWGDEWHAYDWRVDHLVRMS